jgi:hypothetical protein
MKYGKLGTYVCTYRHMYMYMQLLIKYRQVYTHPVYVYIYLCIYIWLWMKYGKPDTYVRTLYIHVYVVPDRGRKVHIYTYSMCIPREVYIHIFFLSVYRQSLALEDRESRRTDWLEEHKDKIQV